MCWLPGSEQITNFFEVQFFADVLRANSNDFFVFGFEASMEWLRGTFQVERKLKTLVTVENRKTPVALNQT